MRIISAAAVAIVVAHAGHAFHHNPATIVLHHAMMAAVDRSFAASGMPNGMLIVAGIWPVIGHASTSPVVGFHAAAITERAY